VLSLGSTPIVVPVVLVADVSPVLGPVPVVVPVIPVVTPPVVVPTVSPAVADPSVTPVTLVVGVVPGPVAPVGSVCSLVAIVSWVVAP